MQLYYSVFLEQFSNHKKMIALKYSCCKSPKLCDDYIDDCIMTKSVGIMVFVNIYT